MRRAAILAERPWIWSFAGALLVWLAAIAPLAAFLATVRFSASLALTQLIVTYALSLAMVRVSLG